MKSRTVLQLIYFYICFNKAFSTKLSKVEVEKNSASDDEELTFIRSSIHQNYDVIKKIKDRYEKIEADTNKKFKEKLTKVTEENNTKTEQLKAWHNDSIKQIKRNHKNHTNENKAKLLKETEKQLKLFNLYANQTLDEAIRVNEAESDKLVAHQKADIASLKIKQLEELNNLKEKCDSEYNSILNDNNEKLIELKKEEYDEIKSKVSLLNEAELSTAYSLGIDKTIYLNEKRKISDKMFPTFPDKDVKSFKL